MTASAIRTCEPLDPVLLILPYGFPHIVERLDGTFTGLNAIGLAIIEAGFSGVRGHAVEGPQILWQWRLDTPEGVCFAALLERAKHGLRVPSVEYVMEILRPLLKSNDRRDK